MKLMNPGPVTLTARVRGAMQREDLCHREPDFAALLGRVCRRLLDVEPALAGFVPLVLGGSGTCAVEAMVGTFVPKGGRALLVDNGVYGERMGAMLTAQGKDFDRVTSPWTAGVDVAGVHAQLGARAYDAVLAVHHETTTGRRNDVEAIAAACAHHGVPLLLDAVSSFGAEAMPTAALAEGLVLAIAATANKCLHGAPGVCFVVADERLLARPSGATSLYLDLGGYRALATRGFTPFTPPVHALFALDAALDEFFDGGGRAARHARYSALSARARAGLLDVDVAPLLTAAESSVCLTAFQLPRGVGWDALHDACARAGYVVYAGQGALAATLFRIAVMGDLTTTDVDAVVTAIARLTPGAP